MPGSRLAASTMLHVRCLPLEFFHSHPCFALPNPCLPSRARPSRHHRPWPGHPRLLCSPRTAAASLRERPPRARTVPVPWAAIAMTTGVRWSRESERHARGYVRPNTGRRRAPIILPSSPLPHIPLPSFLSTPKTKPRKAYSQQSVTNEERWHAERCTEAVIPPPPSPSLSAPFPARCLPVRVAPLSPPPIPFPPFPLPSPSFPATGDGGCCSSSLVVPRMHCVRAYTPAQASGPAEDCGARAPLTFCAPPRRGPRAR